MSFAPCYLKAGGNIDRKNLCYEDFYAAKNACNSTVDACYVACEKTKKNNLNPQLDECSFMRAGRTNGWRPSYTDTSFEGRQCFRGASLRGGPQLLLHLERGMQRALRVVFVRDRGSEHREDAVGTGLNR